MVEHEILGLASTGDIQIAFAYGPSLLLLLLVNAKYNEFRVATLCNVT